MPLDSASPFVLIDAPDAATPGRLYRAPATIVAAQHPHAVAPALAEIERAVAGGREAAGFLGYEAGAALEPALASLAVPATAPPLLWFGLFDRHDPIARDDVPALLGDPAGCWVGRPVPSITRADYDSAFARILDLIAAGDIYQANLTFRAMVPVGGDPLALYAAIRDRAAAAHAALVWTGEDWLLSFSPELFFALDAGVITTRPMKGTARRAASPDADRAAAAALAEDPKQRAENLMIVDLMRNDLTRVARPGSVATPHLFAVETYPSIHQMTSTVTAALAPGTAPAAVLAALFPCGSITGAPKIRAIEVIAAVEQAPRGAYTGAIGWMRDDRAAFSVAIRTLHLRPGAAHATIGLGSGIVADSIAAEEYDECLAKGAFLTHRQRPFDLIETMAFDPETGIALLDRHLGRMKASAEAFDFAFDRHAARNELQAATFRLRAPRKVRLVLARSGAIAIEVAPMPALPADPLRVALAPLPVAPGDFRLAHKTSDRAFYDHARAASGADEVVFVDPAGQLTEGSVTSLFVDRGGTLVTPPLARGLLPGVLRAELIDAGRAIEGDLTPTDLADGFFVGNALRGLMPAVAVAKEAPR